MLERDESNKKCCKNLSISNLAKLNPLLRSRKDCYKIGKEVILVILKEHFLNAHAKIFLLFGCLDDCEFIWF